MSESDITNYAYVWYKRDTTQLLEFTEDELEKIYEILLNYSYPCYLSGSEIISRMSPQEKIKLLQHELLFIEEKMAEAGLAHIIIMQIPRILYDLFNLYSRSLVDRRLHYNSRFYRSSTDYYVFDYECHIPDNSATNMNAYNTLTRKYTDFAKQGILNHIRNHYSIPNIREFYHKISEEILSLCWKIDAIIKTSILFDIMEEAALEEAKEKRRNIVRQIINFEKQHSKGYGILYRGALMHDDSLIDYHRRGCSLSFNASILSGCVSDDTGCTLSISTGIRYRYKDNIKCNLKKFLLNDSSDEDSLFFIPPIHPFLQVYSRGELFHPRTKLGADFKSFSSIRGLSCEAEQFESEQFEYLISDKSFEQLNALYKNYKSTDVISIWSSHSEAAIFQEAARIGASLPRLLQKMKQKSEEQKATRLSLENAVRMKEMNKKNPIGVKYLTKLGFGGRKTRKKYCKACIHITNSNKNKKKYKKNNKTLKCRCRYKH